MKILHLTLKKKWFDLVASGVKKEEYREIRPYWDTRLNKHYDAVLFRNGYSKYAPEVLVELLSVTTGKGSLRTGAPADREVYILRLGGILRKDLDPADDAAQPHSYETKVFMTPTEEET